MNLHGAILFTAIEMAASAEARRETFDLTSWTNQSPERRIADAPMAERDKHAVEKAIVARGRTLLCVTASDEEISKLPNLTTVKLFDMTGDGVLDVIAEIGDTSSGLCGPTGNCPWWILRKQGANYVPILRSFGQALSTNCRRKGRPCDVSVSMHGSVTEFSIKVYRFLNIRYAEIAEYAVVWPLDEEGKTAAKPEITRVR